MELVLLADMQSSYASNWIRIANTSGIDEIHVGDRFRERGFGSGAEELEVAGVEVSPVGGASRIFVHRAANATQPEVHRIGCVFLPVHVIPAMGERNPLYQPLRETIESGVTEIPTGMTETEFNHSHSVHTFTDSAQVEAEAPVVPKRGRGRPPGSKNKTKEEIKLPVGFE